MIQKTERNDRRCLAFPAVRPCESVSPDTLLTSLITLSHNICDDQSRFFATQRRNVRESIRQVGILLIFFEHLRHLHPSSLNESFALAFSELHLALQKIQFLLEDCSRPGARVWILMKSHLVAAKFHMAIRLIATALDILPSLPLDPYYDTDDDWDTEEVFEMLRMLGRQARKSTCQVVELSDQLAMERVLLILNEFENKYEPERCLIKQVLEYLGIRSWSDCDREIRFLEEEINVRNGDGNIREEKNGDGKRELPLLNGLVALMCYCRGVIFEDPPIEELNQTADGLVLDNLRCLNPEDFRCPISLELMTDPVTISTGQTYDRVSIQKWLKSGHLICPKTGEKLSTREVVPNSALKKIIQQFCSDNGISITRSASGRDIKDISRTTLLPGSPAAREAIRFLSEFLTARLTYGTEEQKNKAAYEVRLLAKLNVYNRIILVRVGSIPPLFNLLTSTDPIAQENSIASLLKLAKHSSGQKSIIENGGLGLILSVLRNGLKIESRNISAAVLFYLASVDKYRGLIGRNQQTIPSLIVLVSNGNPCGKRNSMAALFSLLLHRGNRERALMAGIVPLLVDIIGSAEKGEIITDGLGILAIMAEDFDGSVAIMQTYGLALVMGLVRSSSIPLTGKEYCVSIMYSLCTMNGEGEMVVEMIAKESQIMPYLYALTVDGNVKAEKMARALVNMVQRHRESSSSRLIVSAAVCKEGAIRVG